MTVYDSDERIHRPVPSFLSRPPTRAERRRLRRLFAALPPVPELVFWPESIAIDGPWSDGRAGLHPQHGHRRHRPDGPDGPERDRRHRRDGPDTVGRNGWHHRRHQPAPTGANRALR